jgi:hypothetical protein
VDVHILKTEPIQRPYTKLTENGGWNDITHLVKWVLKCKTIKLLEGKIRENLHDIRLGGECLETRAKVLLMKE